MRRLEPGDAVVVNEKVRGMRRPTVRPGMRGVVDEIASRNPRRNSLWVWVWIHGKAGNVVGRVKMPANWLDVEHARRPEEHALEGPDRIS